MRIFEPSVENFSFVSERDFRRAGSVRLIRQNLSFLRDNIRFNSTRSVCLALPLSSAIKIERDGSSCRSCCDPCELKHMDRFARRIKNAGS